MELQLGLALPMQSPMEPFDLNRNGFEPKEMGGWMNGCCLGVSKVRGNNNFAESFEHGGIISRNCQKLTVCSWNGQPDEEDDGKGEKKGASLTSDTNGKEENYVVGWPPIKSWRMKLLHQQQHGGRIMKHRTAERGGGVGGGGGGGRSNSTYVKVKMEGVAIGRKIDLRLFHSYQTLTNALIGMFAKYKENEENNEGYTLLYQDREGDWLLAGDVPWQTFMDSVARLEILRNAG
ncbi:hypothetical protein U1Q18_018635 [Sarracenia purpurea var. burkii]